MNLVLVYLLIAAIIAGELIKFPLSSLQVGTLLDLAIIILCSVGLIRLKFKLVPPPISIKLALVFVGIGCLSLLLTPLHLQINQYLFSFSYTIRFFLFVLLGWIIYSGGLISINKYLQEIFIISGVLLSLLGFLQLIFVPDLAFLQSAGWDPHFLRTVSTFLDPNFLGVFLGCVLLIIITYKRNFQLPGISIPKNISQKLINIFFVIVYLADITTFSRSALLMFSVSFIVLSALKKSLKLLVLTIILTVIFGLAYLGYNQVVANIRHINRTQSAELRISSWHLGIELIKHYPVLGVGFNSYRYGLEQNHLAPKFYTSGHAGSSNDSSLIFVMSTTGVVGLISYGLFLLSIFIIGRRYFLKNQTKGLILLAGLSGLMVNSLFIDSLFYPWILLWLILESTKPLPAS